MPASQACEAEEASLTKQHIQFQYLIDLQASAMGVCTWFQLSPCLPLDRNTAHNRPDNGLA